ncbi:MAG: phage holin family protein [Thermoleophilia bacterium]|nr:phage holin family protein [Thermoleophilia bacterium]
MATARTSRQYMDARHSVPDDTRSLGEIVSDLTSHSQELLRGEVALAKRELADNAKQLGGAAAMGAAAVPFVQTALVLFGISLGFGLANVVDAWLAFLISGIVFALVAGGLAMAAKSRAKDASVAPTTAIDGAKEDLAWIKAHSG